MAVPTAINSYLFVKVPQGKNKTPTCPNYFRVADNSRA